MTILGTTTLTQTSTTQAPVADWTALALTEAGGGGEVDAVEVTTTGSSFLVRVAGQVRLAFGQRSGVRLYVTVDGVAQAEPIATVEAFDRADSSACIAGAQVIVDGADTYEIGLTAERLGGAKLMEPLVLVVEEVG